MPRTSWLTGLCRRIHQRRFPQRASQASTCKPGLEPLEDRLCPSYTVIDLDTLYGHSEAYALNDNGQIVGEAGSADAFLWENGVMTDLGTMGQDSSAAYDINDSGQVVGVAGGLLGSGAPNLPTHAFLWQNGVMTDIGGPGSQARAINNAGQIVGNLLTGSATSAVVWENGVLYNLDTLLPAGSNIHLISASDINDNGQITGLASFNGVWAPFLLTDDDGIFANGGVAVADLSGWGFYGEGVDLNQAGTVAGWMEFAGEGTNHAVLYQDGGYADLTFEETTSYANAINDVSQIVGRYFPWTESWSDFHAFFWQDGQLSDLNNLIDSSSGWVLTDAADINQQGDIVGKGMIGGQLHAVLLHESNLPSLMINDVTVTEGNSGTTNAVFTVSLSAASDQLVAVTYAATNGIYNPAWPGSDFQAVSGTLTFAPGETSKTIVVPVFGDTATESNETFYVNLGSHTNAVLAKSQGQGTILNDDPPLLVITDTSVTEGNSGTRTATFTVWLYYPFTQPVTVNYATTNGTATAGSDYQSTSGTLTFNPGQTSKTITVLVKGDRLGEPNETFVVNLSNPTNAIISDGQGQGTILDDEPRISINDATLAEGQSGIKYFIFTVSLSAASDVTVTVNFATANGTAKKSEDYTAASGTLTFAPGETTKTIAIAVIGDKKKEANETFFVNLSSATNALLADSQGLGTILNDD